MFLCLPPRDEPKPNSETQHFALRTTSNGFLPFQNASVEVFVSHKSDAAAVTGAAFTWTRIRDGLSRTLAVSGRQYHFSPDDVGAEVVFGVAAAGKRGTLSFAPARVHPSVRAAVERAAGAAAARYEVQTPSDEDSLLDFDDRRYDFDREFDVLVELSSARLVLRGGGASLELPLAALRPTASGVNPSVATLAFRSSEPLPGAFCRRSGEEFELLALFRSRDCRDAFLLLHRHYTLLQSLPVLRTLQHIEQPFARAKSGTAGELALVCAGQRESLTALAAVCASLSARLRESTAYAASLEVDLKNYLGALQSGGARRSLESQEDSVEELVAQLAAERAHVAALEEELAAGRLKLEQRRERAKSAREKLSALKAMSEVLGSNEHTLAEFGGSVSNLSVASEQAELCWTRAQLNETRARLTAAETAERAAQAQIAELRALLRIAERAKETPFVGEGAERARVGISPPIELCAQRITAKSSVKSQSDRSSDGKALSIALKEIEFVRKAPSKDGKAAIADLVKDEENSLESLSDGLP